MLPSNRKEVFRFTYNIDEKSIDLTQELAEVYGMPTHFDNMPYSFAERHVLEEDREAFIEAYESIDGGEAFVTVDFRVDSMNNWARVCMFRAGDSSPIVSGVVQDVSIRYNFLKAETARAEEAINLRRRKEVEALQLMHAVNESSEMMISVNLTQNTYYMMSYDRFLNQTADSDGVFDDLIAIGVSTIPDDGKEEFEQAFGRENLLKAYARGEKMVYLEHQQYGEDGELHWVATQVMFTENPYSDDVMEITVSRNIDARRQKAEEQRQVLKDALLLAEKANDAKSDFLSRMSHDIRTPMNAIIGMTTIATANAENPQKVKECLNKIGISSKFLLGLINDILDLSKIESGKMSLNEEPFDLKELLVEIAEGALDLAQSKHQQFYFSVAEDVADVYLGDRVRVEQIILNLINNAHKYTDEGGEYELRVSRVRRVDDRDIIQFVVRDNGQGISEEFLDKLFDPFTQEVNDTNRTGSGLGLAIVQNLVHLMSGRIHIDTKEGVGSTFTVEIPFAVTQEEENRTGAVYRVFPKSNNAEEEEEQVTKRYQKSGEAEAITFQGQRVLLVEDNEFNQEIAKTILEMHGLEVDVVSDGCQAIETFMATEAEYYLAIFMDIQMPGMDGYEATRRIRGSEHPEAKSIPIYAMTANAYASDVDKARLSGMDGHIAKPVDFDIVARILEEILLEKK